MFLAADDPAERATWRQELIARLDWFNGHYMRQLSPDELTERALPFLLAGLPEDVRASVDTDYAREVFTLDQERFKTLRQLATAQGARPGDRRVDS